MHSHELATWRQSATQALATPEEARSSPQQTQQDRRRIKELERELLPRSDRASAETAALLVLSKKVAAIFNKGEAE